MPKFDFSGHESIVDLPKLEAAEAHNNSHLYTKEWYKVFPNCKSPSFPSFMYSSVELAIEVCGKRDVQLEIGDRVDSAYADIENGKIILAPHSLISEAIQNRGYTRQEETEIMVAATNGLIIHEAMHLRESPVDLHYASEIVRVKFGSPKIGGPPWFAFLNICEDIYIEWRAKQRHQNLAPFISAAHEFWFPKGELLKRISKFLMSREVEAERYGGAEFIDMIIAFKNWHYADLPVWRGILGKYNDKLKEFREVCTQTERLGRIFSLWQEICADPQIRWSAIALPNEADKYDSGGIMITVDSETLKELKAECGEGKTTSRRMTIPAIIDEVNKELEKRNIVIRIEKKQTALAKVPPMVTEEIKMAANELEPDPRFVPLAKKLRSSLTKNYAPGQPLTRGPKLVSTRLQRIVTDGKIFTYPEIKQRTGRDYEVIILVDCSGSMAGGHPNKINEAMRVGLAAWISMKEARIRTVLVGHTSTHFERGVGDETPVLYIIGKHNDNTMTVARRARHVIEGRGLFNNYDGYAVEKACEFFSEKPTKKWLIVISDGQPAGKDYHGGEAVIHTRLAANKARGKGIDVVSITIEDGAYKTNDMIYGEKKNIHTRSSKALLDLVEAMFTKHKGEENGKAKRDS